MRFETRAVHVGEEPDMNGPGDVVAPIHVSTTFARTTPETPTTGYDYTRTSNPTRKALEQKLAAVENGSTGLAFSSGLSAESTALLTILNKDDRVLASDDLYGGTRRIFNNVLNGFGISVILDDMKNPEGLSGKYNGVKAIWIETPSNPLMKVLDIRMVSELASEIGAYLVVDNTFASPFFQNPLDLGADIVVHSTTKYINGHSDSLGGAIVVRDQELGERLRFNQNAVGAVLSPFDSFLTLRGLKTLALRMKQHEINATRIAELLASSNKVSEVNYPGMQENEYYEIARKQMRGFGGMISFRLEKGYSAGEFVKSLNYFSLAESLGGVESLVEIPYFMTHASVPEDERKKGGIDQSLIRMSAGIENTDDLEEDVESALKALAKQ